MYSPAMVDFSNPLLWAILVAWIATVAVHEFSHGLVAYLGGDYTIRERGGLTLNPLQYIDPVMSILLPAVMLIMGGIPLPGGATYIHRDLLRSKGWQTAVSLAGPASNFILCALFLAPLHPAFGWVDTTASSDKWSNFQVFLAAMGVLQWMTALFNLIPVPPLDGFNAILPTLAPETQEKLNDPQIRNGLMIGLFLLLVLTPNLSTWTFERLHATLRAVGYDRGTLEFIRQAFNYGLWGRSG